MNYQWHYDKLIETRKQRKRVKGQYYENHHIIMRSMSGDNSEQNLVHLTAREHFLAHWLLWRIHRNRSSAFAFFTMRRTCKYQERVFSSRGYQEAMEAVSKMMSEMRRGKVLTLEQKAAWCSGRPQTKASIEKMVSTRKANGSYNFTSEHRKKISNASKNRIISDKTREKLSASHKGKISNANGCKWYNNGQKSILIKGEAPEGYIKGRLKSTIRSDPRK